RSRMHYESFGFSISDSPTMLAKVDAGLHIDKADVADMGIDSSGEVYTWWNLPVGSGGAAASATAGKTGDLGLDQPRFDVAMPSPETMSTVVGVGISKSTNNVYAFYSDWTRSVGHTDNFSAVSGAVTYTLPSGYAPGDIIAIDISPDGRFWAWY